MTATPVTIGAGIWREGSSPVTQNPQGRSRRRGGERKYTREELERLMGEVEAGRDKLLTPQEVSLMCRVDPKTVTRWAQAGKLRSIRLGGEGGHRRYAKSEVYAKMLDASAD